MEDLRQKRMLEISGQMLDILLDKRKKEPDFTFALRKKNAKDRTVEKGFWFQGSDYLCVPLFKRVDNDRKISTIGFIIELDEAGSIKRSYIQFSFRSDKITGKERKLYRDLATGEESTFSKDDVVLLKFFENPDSYLENLKYYLEVFRPKVSNLLEDRGMSDSFLIPEDEFVTTLDRVEKAKTTLENNSPTPSETNQVVSLNQILFGPPGTGKTYHTINRALEILEGKTQADFEKETREALTARFKDYQRKGQIAFCTFHQSMSYEDFVEGIKPVMKKDGIANEVGYKIEPGVFKRICHSATFSNTSNFEEAYQRFLEAVAGLENGLEIPLEKGKLRVFSSPNGEDLDLESDSHIKTIFKSGLKYVDDTQKFIGKWGLYYKAIFRVMTDSYGYKVVKNKEPQPYVLIIDEINRGNVSQIFGELITLIEEDKRAGKDEAVEVVLPYSKEPFSVPPNLYIIGTMNTADRSVEALDTALRRRFVFEEKPPITNLLESKEVIRRFWNRDPTGKYSSETWKDMEWKQDGFDSLANSLFELLGIDRGSLEKQADVFIKDHKAENDLEDWLPEHFEGFELTQSSQGINLQILLETINDRIEVLLSKDHQIGHSYFMKVYSFDQLKTAFFKSIIPLLQEYFYGDYGKIGLVLGSGFVRIKQDPQTKKVKFASFTYQDEEDLQRLVYELIPEKEVDMIQAIGLLINASNGE